MDKIGLGDGQGRGREISERLAVVQELMSAADRASYRQREASAAERLELSISSIQRLVREWKKQGVGGLS